MSRLATLLMFGCAAFGAVGTAQAEGRRTIPIEHDLRRMDEIDARLARNGSLPLDVEETGSIGSQRPVTPYAFGDYWAPGYGFRAHGDPSGVVGFSGPPGIYGDSVNSFSPLPPGSPATRDGEW